MLQWRISYEVLFMLLYHYLTILHIRWNVLLPEISRLFVLVINVIVIIAYHGLLLTPYEIFSIYILLLSVIDVATTMSIELAG